MWRKIIIGIALVSIASAASARDSKNRDNKNIVKNIVADVGRSMGVDKIHSIQYTATGSFFFFGQSYRASDAWPQFVLRSYVRNIDYDNRAAEERFTIAQAEDGERGGGFLPVKGVLTQDALVSGQFAWTVGSVPAVDFEQPVLTDARQIKMALTPAGWVKAAATADLKISSTKINGNPVTVVSFLWNDKYRIVGYVSSANELEKVEARLPQSILGDMVVEFDYSEYRDFSGFKFPAKIVEKEGGFPVLDLNVTSLMVNPPVDIVVPQDVRDAKPAEVQATSQRLAEGVWVLRAGTQSLGVEFKDYMVIVDSYGNEARSRAVIAEMKRLVPNKPVKYVVNTHHHLDHSGGLRTFVAEGATVITAEENRPYFEKIFKQPHKLDPDELAIHPRQPKFVTVKDKFILSDGDQSLELYTLPNNTHSSDILVAYAPKAKAMLVGDIYNPNPTVAPRPNAPPPQSVTLVGDKELLRDNLRDRKLNVEVFVGIHGNGTTPFSDLDKAIDIEHQQLRQVEASR